MHPQSLFKRLLPFLIFIGLAILTGKAINQGLTQSNTPLLGPEHPKVVAGEQPNVVLYSAEWCSYCKAARVYFQRKSVPFTELDIEKNPTAYKEYKRLGGRGVPLITVEKTTIRGFDKSRFAEVYLAEASKP